MLQALKSSFGWKLGAKRFDPDRIVLCARRKDPIAVPLIFEFATWPVFFANLNQVRLFFHKPVSEMKHIFWRGVQIILGGIRYQRLGWFFRSMDLDERCLVAADVT